MTEITHPLAQYLRTDRMPHIWCPGCGIGTAMGAFLRAVASVGLDPQNMVIVSGIGCTGRVAGYVRMDSFHTTHGRALTVATGIKLARPELKVVVFSGDGDLTSIGGNHFIHAARRNMDISVICINNFNYGMTGGQVAPTTPTGARTSTTMQGNPDSSFNLPALAAVSGAVYVARWTVAHVRQLEKAMTELLRKEGFGFLEVISPCPTLFGRRNKLGAGLDMVKAYRKRAVVKNGGDPREAELDMESPIMIGKFVDIEHKPTYLERIGIKPLMV